MTLDDLDFTGERMVPGKVDSALLNEHIARYQFAMGFINSGMNVLDAACGSGYGSYMMASVSSHVIGMDISDDAIRYASKIYSKNNLEFICGNVISMPFEDSSFDLITGFEIFEHIENPGKMLNEMKRVLKPGGVLLISTPNANYEKSTVKNVFHVREYSLDEFRTIIRTELHVEPDIRSQRSTSGSSSLKRSFISLKRKLGIGPLMKKRVHEIGSPDDLFHIEPPYEIDDRKIENAETFIAVIHPGV